MLQCVLTIAGPELHLAEELDELRMDIVNADLKDRSFTFLAHHVFNFLLRFLHHLFNSRRMDTSIHEQAL